MTELPRREFLTATAGLTLMTPLAGTAAVGAVPVKPLGKPGDFDFLTGEWRIQNKFLEADKWIEFAGEATIIGLLKGIASVEELRIPARNFYGMGLRLLDVEKKVWNDHWVNAKSGVVTVPGQQGIFVDGVGNFISEDKDDKGAILYRGVWDRITPRSCRWFQGWSRDAGQSWTDTWFMDWTRV